MLPVKLKQAVPFLEFDFAFGHDLAPPALCIRLIQLGVAVCHGHSGGTIPLHMVFLLLTITHRALHFIYHLCLDVEKVDWSI